jgi:hypothetical protein
VASVFDKRSHDLLWYWLTRVCSRSKLLARGLEIVGNIASFASWQMARGLEGGGRYPTRESLWRAEIPPLRIGKATVLEFGVALGHGTRLGLSMLHNDELRWHGFDTFTGLPQPWERGGLRFVDAGAFDVGGAPPQILDPRVTWHVGLLEETLPGVTIDFESPLLVLFDLDLYEPSAFALALLEERFKPGDILYFDEAYDPWHERRLIDEFVDRGHRVRALGSTGTALMLEYQGSR